MFNIRKTFIVLILLAFIWAIMTSENNIDIQDYQCLNKILYHKKNDIWEKSFVYSGVFYQHKEDVPCNIINRHITLK